LSVEEESESEATFLDNEVVQDSTEVTHFLPPTRCRNCDD